MGPSYNCNIQHAAVQAHVNLSRAMDQLKANNIDDARKRLRLVIEILRDMNDCYDKNNLIYVDDNGNKLFSSDIFGVSAAYNFPRNTYNIKKIKACIRRLDLSKPQTDIVIRVLQGKMELPD